MSAPVVSPAIRPVQPSRFPDVDTTAGDQPIARGGDLEPATLLDAYTHGVFPWPAAGEVWWWSPDPRAIIPLDGLQVSRTLARTLRQGGFSTSLDRAFGEVVRGCTEREEGTWITPDMVHAYSRLHALGHAHSLEVWNAEGALVGGLYGIALGGAFIGESMFHRESDASKVALVSLAERMTDGGFTLLDAQLQTPHLERLGAVTIPRDAYLQRLRDAMSRDASLGDPGERGTCAPQPQTQG